MTRRRLRREEYTVGWLCALPVELAAAQEMLDEEHEDLEQDENDNNLYALGQVGGHNVVLGCLPAGQTGIGSAAAVAVQLRATFKWIQFGLMVGIGGGVPSKEDIRLGDVVVSQPYQGHGGVIQYDFGKATPSGFERTGFLNSPTQVLLSAVARMQANHLRRRSKLPEHVLKVQDLPEFTRDNAGPDVLYEASYNHVRGESCEMCSADKVVDRQPRKSDEIAIHYGTIASGNLVMRDGTTRDNVSRDFGGVLCFEMEAAGMMNNFPSLVIRGICDYADSHKNKRWQAYAAVAAAACAKELLSVIPAADVVKTRTVEETIRATSKRALSPSYNIPFLRNRRFIGRGTVLEELTQKLLVNKECQRVALVGLGGIGKTQVALEFAYTVKASWPEYSIFWVPALSMESMEQACADIASIRGIPQAADDKEDIKEHVRQYLSDKAAGQWLLIVDNADDIELLFRTGQSKGIVDYLPQSEHGLIIFTTRHQEVAVSLAHSDVIELEEMNQEEAVSFLEKSLVRKHLLSNNTTTTELLDELTYLPLAIAQAAAYLNRNKISILDYLRLLRNTEQDIISLMSQEFWDSTRYKNSANAVARTWLVSFDQIRDRDTVAAELLSFMSCIEPKAIPRSILPIVQPEERMVRAIGTLCGYSFIIKRSNKDIYDMHRLVHLATGIWVEKHGIAMKIVEKAIQHVSNILPNAEYASRAIWREYLTHALRLLRGKLGKDIEERYTLCLKVGMCLADDGRIREAVAWLEESYQWRQSNLAEEHPSRLTSQHELASVYKADGQVKKAVKLLEHVVAVEARVLAEEHPSRLASQHALANAYEADGQVKKAVELLEHVAAVRTRVLAEEHPSRLVSQRALANAYKADGQVKKAVELLEHVVAVEARVLAEEHPDRLASQHALASAYEADRQVKKAVELLEHVAAVRTRVLAEEHPSRLVSQRALANAYKADGQVKKAVELLEHVVAVEARVLAEEHPDRLASQHALASAYEADGQVKKAVELLEHVAAVRTRVLAEEHPSRLVSQRALANAYKADGQVKKAVELLEHVAAVRTRVLAEEHPSRLVSQRALASAYEADGQVKKAVELLEHVVAVSTRVLAEEHPSRLASQHELASVYKADGQVKKAVKLLEHVAAVSTRVLAEEHPSQLASQHELASVYKADGQVKKAVKLLEHVVAVEARVLAEEHPSRLASQHALANAYEADGQVKKAVELLEHVAAVRTRVLAEEHPDRLASQHKLASVYKADGQVKKAVKLLEHVVAVEARVLAEEHPSRLASQHALAIAYKADRQVKKAVELLEHVVAVEARVLAEEHPDQLASQHALASAYEADGQVKKAVELLEHVVAVSTRVLAEEHPDRLASQHELASVYKADGQVKKAVKLLEHVVAVEARVLAEEHPSRLASQHALAIAYKADRQVKKAVELLEHVVAVEARVLAEEHPSRLISQRALEALASNPPTTFPLHSS